MEKNSIVLVAGGAGYIGSHMVRMLMDEGYSPVVFDNLSTGHGELVPKGVPLVAGDLSVREDLRRLFDAFPASAVMHFAASSLVGESVRDPFKYYSNNVLGCIRLVEILRERGVGRLILSSTAAVYGAPDRTPIREEDEKRPSNPYGRSKLMIETMLADLSRADILSYVALRYFNACGAHPAAETGEWHEPETHLIANALRAASGAQRELTVFGDDYPTPDGTCVRDYVHVQDLCRAHLQALELLQGGLKSGIFNLGNGNGYSVKEVIRSAERVTGKKIRVRIGARRPGDPPVLVASAERAKVFLGWEPGEDLDGIIRSAWEWEKRRAVMSMRSSGKARAPGSRAVRRVQEAPVHSGA